MTLREPSKLVEFDADAAVEELLERAGEEHLIVAEYTPEEYGLLYVGEGIEAMYPSMDEIEATADSIHEYIDMDFRERELFLDLYPTIDDVDGLITVGDTRCVVRVVTPQEEGLYFSVPNELSATELLQHVVDIIEAST